MYLHINLLFQVPGDGNCLFNCILKGMEFMDRDQYPNPDDSPSM